MKRIPIIGLIVASLFATAAPAKGAKKKGARPAKVARQSGARAKELQTDVRFDDSVLRGQYQVPEEALAKVENEKGLSDLLGVRKHFKDRLLESAGQE